MSSGSHNMVMLVGDGSLDGIRPQVQPISERG